MNCLDQFCNPAFFGMASVHGVVRVYHFSHFFLIFNWRIVAITE